MRDMESWFGRFHEAEAVYREAIRRRDGWAKAHWNLAVLLLGRGRWTEGFAEFQWRLKHFPLPGIATARPAWDGAPVLDRHLLLWAEQGAGDAIQFLRFVPMAARRAGRITLCLHKGLVGLGRQVEGVARVVAFGEPLDDVDVQAPLMSLPHLLGATTPSMFWTGPYLSAPGGPMEKTDAGPLRVGLVWSGNPDFVDNARRACPPRALVPLTEVPGAEFYSLQKGAAAEAAGRDAFGRKMIDLAPRLRDFADTARAIFGLDLVIGTDTAVPHLAAAMGTPVWLMLHHAPDWRWQSAGDQSVWYPDMRLFRQQRPGDWETVVRRIQQGLLHRCKEKIPS